jgi:hypothetical protein
MKKLVGVITTVFIIYFSLGFLVYKTGINTLPIQSEDTLPAMFLPSAILQEGTLYLDSHYDTMVGRYPHPDDKDYSKGMTPFYLRKVNNHYVSAFPIITPLLALPVYFVGITILKMAVSWGNLILLSHIASALIMAVAAGALYKLLKKLTSEKNALLLTAAYAFGTVNFAMLSQSLWQHGTVQLFLILATYFLVTYLENDHPKDIVYTGMFLGLAILSRPTAGLSFVLFGIFLLYKKKGLKSGLLMTLGLLPSIAFFAWYNSIFYGTIANQGYSNQIFTEWLSPYPISFIGVWLSPSKGILVYSPIFIFSFLGVWKAKQNKYFLFALIIYLHTLIISLWKHWYGGYSFGYRMSSDILPYLILLLVPFTESELYGRWGRPFVAALVGSILVQLGGLVFFDSIWHAAYDRGFTDTAWLWSLRDSEFMFNVRRVLVKIGMLDRACPQCL